MGLRTTLFLAAALAGAAVPVAPTPIAAAEPAGQITILYDAFGTDAAMKEGLGLLRARGNLRQTNPVRQPATTRTSSQRTSRRRVLTSPASISWCCHTAIPITWLA